MNNKYLLTIFVLVLFALPAISHAGVSDNASGFAWSENIGWVSFNCTNDHNEIQPGVQTCIDMGGKDYGVNVRQDDYLEGYAWSSNIGWISFNLADTGAPPGQYDYSNQGYIAKLQGTNLRGWARALAGMDDPNDGWDGWIKLKSPPNEEPPSYGVTYNISNSEFSGWAWGDAVIGWLSFNCGNEGTCLTSDYKVVADTNQPPSAGSLKVEGNYSGAGNACFSPPDHTFTWNFSDSDGDPQDAYQLQIDDSPTFASMPEEGGTPDAWDVDTGKVLTLIDPRPTERKVNVVKSPSASTIGYNRTYYWRLKVWDQVEDSGWISPNPANSPFSTAPHVYPTSLFNFAPASPSEGEEITFTQASICYDINNNQISCPAIDGNYSWDFDYETPPFTQDDVGQSVKHTYADTDTHTIALDTTDAEGQTCRGEGNLIPQAPLPEFRETSPTSFFENIKNFLASIAGGFRFDMFHSIWATTTKNL